MEKGKPSLPRLDCSFFFDVNFISLAKTSLLETHSLSEKVISFSSLSSEFPPLSGHSPLTLPGKREKLGF